MLQTNTGRTFGFSCESISLNLPIPKEGEYKRNAVLKIYVSDHVLKGLKEMPEVQANSLGLEKPVVRKLRED